VKWDHAAPTRGLRLVEAGRCPPHPVRSLPTTAPTKGTTKQAAVMTKKVLRVRWTGRPMGLSRLFYGGTGRALQPSPWMKAQPLRGSELGIDAVSAADLWTRQADPLAGRPAPSLGTVRQPPKAPPPARAGDASDIRTRRAHATPGTVGSLSAAVRRLRRWRAFTAYARTLHPSEAFLLKRPFWHDVLEEERSIDCKRRLEDRRAAAGPPACTATSVSAKSTSFLGAPPRRADGGLAAVAHLVDR
jgi:hypothetical protein